ncbi:putative mitochondrial ornithine carrier protein [Lineolata rhizophorae]|uniref:Putative mitochondrial ornithine carrier protein n=1 Tax=Lineolata rhizophorae TaxID=578093 RepID=A0A6A6NZC9_9PEZI|nr:putative mitochondrial ornithine carrier protein [Lineolata rhizophorae]
MTLTEPSVSIAEAPASASAAQKQLSSGVEAFKDIAFGSAAGIAGKFIEYPFDTVKVRLQSQPDGLPLRYSGPVDCFRQSYRQHGFTGFYRGIAAPLAGAAVEASCLFFSYRIAQNAVRSISGQPADHPLSLPALLGCGACSGAFTSFFLTPIEFVKCQLQAPPPTRRGDGPAMSGYLSLIQAVYRHNGLFGFWRGQLGTLVRETGGSAAWFGGYEMTSKFFHLRKKAKNLHEDAPLNIPEQICSGAVAGVAYNFIFYPVDTVKSRMQTDEISHSTGNRRGFWSVAAVLGKQHGLRGFYRGCGITVARSAPASGVIFAVYETLRGFFT